MQVKKKRTDLLTILFVLQENVATNTMVSKATGIPRSSITRYKRDLELKGQLFEVEKKPCAVTGYPAWWLTANPDFVNPNSDGHGE